MRSRRVLAVAAAALVSLTATAGAEAATFKLDRSCYGGSDSTRILATGFAPNEEVGASLSGVRLDSDDGPIVADANGRVSTFLNLGEPRRRRSRELRIFSKANPPNTAADNFIFSPLFVRARGAGPRPSRIRAGGFTDGGRRTLYAHLQNLDTFKVRNKRVGRLRGPCGNLSVKKRLFGKLPRGCYRLVFNTRRRPLAGTDQNYAIPVSAGRRCGPLPQGASSATTVFQSGLVARAPG